MGETLEMAVSDMRGGAEAVLDLEAGSSISIRYHSRFGSYDDIFLLEIDEQLLHEVLRQRTVIRGQPDEEAVLCTPTATYALKFVGTSNSVLLIPPGSATFNEKNGSQIVSVVSVLKLAPGNMELAHIAPKLDKLKALLLKYPYIPEEEEDDENNMHLDRDLYKWVDLCDIIQASDEELKAGLRALSAVEINGNWRVVDDKTMNEVFTLLLHNSVLHEWSLNTLKEDEVISVLVGDGIPRAIALHCLDSFGTKEEKGDGHCVWSLDEKRVCLHFARRILSNGKRKMESFMEEWSQSVLPGMSVSLEMLEGEALTEKIGIETWIRAFSALSLPSAPAERFAALFHERKKWEWKDLQPYVRDLHVPGLSLEGLLIKYTRRTQPTAEAEPIFSAR